MKKAKSSSFSFDLKNSFSFDLKNSFSFWGKNSFSFWGKEQPSNLFHKNTSSMPAIL